MTLTEIRKFANDSIVEHNLHLCDWYFAFSTTKRSLGDCDYNRRRIRFSKSWLHLDEAEIKDTILHEIAHALAGMHDNHYGHGAKWKYWAVRVGARPSRTYKGEVRVPYAWEFIDTRTGEAIQGVRGYHRKPGIDVRVRVALGGIAFKRNSTPSQFIGIRNVKTGEKVVPAPTSVVAKLAQGCENPTMFRIEVGRKLAG